MNNDLIQTEEGKVVQASPRVTALATTPSNPGAVLMYAMEKGADMAQIEKLLDLQMKWEANEARKAFVADMAAFKLNPPKIIKDKLVGYENRDGTFTGYKHATLGAVTNAVIEGLANHGFSHAWEPEQRDGKIYVTCVITHKLGHSTRTTLDSAKDDSGKKNSIQAVGSAITYLQRYTLLLACGLATHDQTDDDGQNSEAIALDKLIADAARAPDVKTLNELWEMHQQALRDTSEIEWTAFKDACNGRKTALERRANPAPGKSSRLADIMGAQAQAGGAA
jgi:hypothetical protein